MTGLDGSAAQKPVQQLIANFPDYRIDSLNTRGIGSRRISRQKIGEASEGSEAGAGSAVRPATGRRTVNGIALADTDLDGLDHDLEGRVAEIQPGSDDATRTRLAKIDLPETPGVRSGRFGRVLLATGAVLAVVVPAEAVVRHGQLEAVFVVASGTARLRLVQTGRERDGRLEIASGLSGDERVVAAGAADLVDGQRVEEAR
jgi:hypothetical protein